MTEQECLEKMVPPGARRKGKYREGVIQIHVTRACNLSCFGCTQGSNLGGKTTFMSPEHFELAVRSLGFPHPDGACNQENCTPYFGVVGVFGGNPATSPHFVEYCKILQRLVPFEQRGLWCNDPMTMEKGRAMAETFDPSVSNLNVHMDQAAFDNFKRWWPSSQPFGLHDDSRHSPPYVAMKDVVRKQCPDCLQRGAQWTAQIEPCPTCNGTGSVPDASRIHELISNCDINQHWSAMVGVFRNELRAWFCEIAGAQAMLHQDEADYPDTGLDPSQEWEVEEHRGGGFKKWWQLSMMHFRDQVRKHCFDCGVPLRGYGELAQADRSGKTCTGAEASASHVPVEQVSQTHAGIYKPKRPGRKVEVVTELVQLGTKKLDMVTKYLQNSRV